MNKLFKKSPLYFFLYTIYPIVFLLSINIGEINPISAIRPALIFLIIGSVIFIIMFAITRNIQRTAFYSLIILLTFFLIFFILYAPIYRALRNVQIAGYVLGRHRILVPLTFASLAIISIILFYFGKKLSQKLLNNILTFFNFVALILTIISIITIISTTVNRSTQNEKENQTLPPIELLKINQSTTMPDIYYIILDMHTNDNVLSRQLNFDDSSFTQALQQRGFFVSLCSQSNYDSTELSLTSSLNFDYLQTLNLPGGDATGKTPAMQNSRVRRMLENAGYTTYAFKTDYWFTEIKDTDHYYAHDRGAVSLITYPGVTSFESLILSISAGQLLYEYRDNLSYKLQVFIDAPFVERREVILNVLDTLPEIPPQPGPKFVFAHMLAPHHPFIFDVNGDPTFRRTPFSNVNDPEFGKGYGWETYKVGYVNEIIYLHKRILEVVDKILSESKTPPIIIIQGDHGVPATKQYNAQFQILNAYYFPNSVNVGLYDKISPVNSFRLLFNVYFDMNFPLLPDKSYITEEEINLFDIQYPCP